MENVYFGILSHLLIANIALGAACRTRTRIGQTVSKCWGQRAQGSLHWMSLELLPPQTSPGLCDGSGLLMRAKFWVGFSPVWETLPQDGLFQCLCCPLVLPSCWQGATISGNVNLGRVL